MAAEPNTSGSGWPLGLESLTFRLRTMETSEAAAIVPNSRHTKSDSFPSYYSSELDTESTGSFFPDRSITLGTLIGMNPIDKNLYIPKSFLPENLESAPMVNCSSAAAMESHDRMFTCCICVPLISGGFTSRCWN